MATVMKVIGRESTLERLKIVALDSVGDQDSGDLV